jgi:hypothetical protein
VVVRPPGSGVVSGPGIHCEDECSYAPSGSVTLTAEANPGYLFKGWGHCPAPSGRRCSVTGVGSLAISANFLKTQNLNVSKAKGSGIGTVTSSPGGISCSAGCTSASSLFLQSTTVKLKQMPSKHFHFAEWLGDCTGAGLCEVSMDKDHEVEAVFARDAKRTLTLTKVGDGYGFVKSKPAGISCSYACKAVEAEFYAGETIELEAEPGKGEVFESWTGCDSEPEGKCRVTMTEAREVVADFGPDVELIIIGPP